jgi:hypothetical protein
MPFRGPSRGVDTSTLLAPYNMQRDQEQTLFDRSMAQADLAQRASRSMGDSWNRIQDRNDQQEEGRARMAMTPGVRAGGGASRWGTGVADSPFLQPRTFDRYGQSYSYDPAMAAGEAGAATGVQQNTEESTRMGALKGIPGITPRMAARMVYGRTGVMDDEDPSVLRSALAEYVRTPSRDAASRAIEAGANLNQFPDRFLGVERGPTGELPIRPEAPVRGTPPYYDMLRQEGNIDTEQLQREAPIRAEATAEYRQPQRKRTAKVTGPQGEIGLIDLDTGQVDWTGEMGAKPGGTSILDSMLSQPGGAPAGPAGVSPDATAAPRGRPAPVVAPAGPAAPGAAPAGDAERQAFTVAYRSLRARGVKSPTSQQVRAEMAGGAPRGRP